MRKVIAEATTGQQLVVPNTQRIERDTMPRQVAIELLCRPGVRMTMRERKTFMQALEAHHTSTRPARDDRRSDILAKRCRGRTWLHLIKRDRRCKDRRKLIQDAHVIATRQLAKLEKREGKPDQKEMLAILFLQRQVAALEVKAKEIELAWDVVTDEINRRKKLCSTANTGAHS